MSRKTCDKCGKSFNSLGFASHRSRCKGKKIKTHYITISEFYPSYHPRKGDPTDFFDSIDGKIKKHTIRGNYNYYKNQLDEVIRGEAIFSIRKWTGEPYNSPQKEIFRLTKDDGIGYEKISLEYDKTWHLLDSITIEGDLLTRAHDRPLYESLLGHLVKNDGFVDEDDFHEWFNWKPLEDGIIIHFTSFRYGKD